MQKKFTYVENSVKYKALAKELERNWGKAISITIFNEDSTVLNQVSFHCHPEQNDYSDWQDKPIEELMDTAIKKVTSGALTKDLRDAREIELVLLYKFQ